MNVDLLQWLSIADAARILNVNERTIRRRVEGGTLKRNARKQVQLLSVAEALKIRHDARGRKLSVRAKPENFEVRWKMEQYKSVQQNLKSAARSIRAKAVGNRNLGLSPNERSTLSLFTMHTTFLRWMKLAERGNGALSDWPKAMRTQAQDALRPMAKLWGELFELRNSEGK